MTGRKMTAALLELMMCASLCACGDSTPPDDAANGQSSVSEQDTAPESKAESDAEEAESAADGEAESGETPADADEPAEVQKVADAYFKAIADGDFETLAQVCDVELMYYIDQNEPGSHEDHVAYLEREFGDKDYYKDAEIGKVVCANSHASEYTDFFKLLDEEDNSGFSLGDKFTVDGMYTVRIKDTAETDVSSDDGDVSVSISGSGTSDMDMAIIHINGEWRADPSVGLAMTLYQIFTGMADAMDSGAGDAASAE